MIGRMVLCLALVCGASAALAQTPACSLYKVNTSLLNISEKAGGDIFIDVLEDGDIACIAREQKVDGRDWGYISYKLEKSKEHTPVDGWSTLRYLTKLSPAEAAALGAGAAPAAAAAAPPPAAAAAPPPAIAKAPPPPAPPAPPAPAVAAAPPAPAAAPPAAVAAQTPAAMRPEDVLRFDQAIPFGAFPVNGHSIKEIIDSDKPLFSPIEGLEDAIWQKKCTECHKWNQARLCEQGKTYVKTPRHVLRVKHPFGGTLKIALMRWAKSGCE